MENQQKSTWVYLVISSQLVASKNERISWGKTNINAKRLLIAQKATLYIESWTKIVVIKIICSSIWNWTVQKQIQQTSWSPFWRQYR